MGGRRFGASAAMCAFAIATVAPVAWSAYMTPEPDFLRGMAHNDLKVESTRPIAAIPDLMAEGVFRDILYLYDISFSPDGSWIAFVLDAIPDKERMHRYYIYLVRRDGSERTLTLETKIGPALSRSFVWSQQHTPIICWPDHPQEIDRAPAEPGPTGSSVRIRGTDPALSPSGRYVAFRQGDEYEASLWVADLHGGGPPHVIADPASPYGEIHWSADERLIAYMAPCSTLEGDSLWAVEPGKRPEELLPIPLIRYEWSPTGSEIATLSDTGELGVIVPGVSGNVVARGVRDFSWAPTSRRLGYIAQPPDRATEAAFVWDLDSRQVYETMASRSVEGWDLSTLRFSPDGGMVYTRGAAGSDVSGDGQYFDRADRVLMCASVGGGARPIEAPIRGSVQQPALSPGGRFMVVTVEYAGGSSLWCIDLATGALSDLGALPVIKYAYGLTWSPDGTALAFEDEGNLMLSRFAQ